MSRMLQALQNLSTQQEDGSAAAEHPAPLPQEETPAASAIPPAAEYSRRVKELLVKHLTPPRPSELLRNLKADLQLPSQAAEVGGRKVSSPAAFSAPPSPTLPLELDDDSEPDASLRESISVTFPMADSDYPVPSFSERLATVDNVENLLATIEEQAESPGEEIAVNFGSEEEEEEKEQRSEVRLQQEEAVPRPSSPSGAPLDTPAPSSPDALSPPLTPAIVPDDSPPLNPEPQTLNPLDEPQTLAPLAQPQLAEAAPAAASPLDHLADQRPLVEYQPEEVAPSVPAPLALPPRTISRSKTRLEQRVLDDLAHPSRSIPYRGLAEKIAQDLRLLSGRCLLFAGVGSASHGDDLLAHLAGLMAEDEAEVLLVDADFTRAGLSVGLGALKETGLGELLDHAGHGEELVLPTLLPNVSVIPAGRKALPDSLGVIDHLAQLLAKLEERFALILIDGGIHTHAISPSLARLCDATYFIVRLGATDARTATTALKAFRGCGARVMGCVATTAAA